VFYPVYSHRRLKLAGAGAFWSPDRLAEVIAVQERRRAAQLEELDAVLGPLRNRAAHRAIDPAGLRRRDGGQAYPALTALAPPGCRPRPARRCRRAAHDQLRAQGESAPGTRVAHAQQQQTGGLGAMCVFAGSAPWSAAAPKPV